MRMKPGVSGWSQNSEQHLNQMNTSNPVYSKRSTALMTKDAHHETALYSQIPAVTFDLGDEWDTWGDFDDENLVHASEISTNDACTANAGPQIQQPGEYYTPSVSFILLKRKIWRISSHYSTIAMFVIIYMLCVQDQHLYSSVSHKSNPVLPLPRHH